MNKKRTCRTVVIIGGGIAGTSAIEALIQDHDDSDPQINRIILITDNKLIKKVTNYERSGRNLERFDVALAKVEEIFADIPNNLTLDTILGTVNIIDTNLNRIFYITDQVDAQQQIDYDVLCICTGSRPRLLMNDFKSDEISKRIIVIRDTQTVEELKEKLTDCRRLVILGNGGISLELIGKIKNCEKIWIIRDESIGLTFFDSGAGKFLLDASTGNHTNLECIASDIRDEYASTTQKGVTNQSENYGPALGPNWLQGYKLEGGCPAVDKLDIIYSDEIESIELANATLDEYPLIVETKNKKQFKCDLVALAIGVDPNCPHIKGESLELSDIDGGILIDEQMRTSVKNIYAAGDVVSCVKWSQKSLWFQMRLWTQARQMGHYLGKCITSHLLNEDPTIYSNFDCFTHCTTFFGYKLVLLGRFNGQSLEHSVGKDRFEIVARVNPGKDYIKILINSESGRVVGAVIVGESGIEETIENLIYDKIDVSIFKDQLLDNTVDIEDYFD